jgi:hypothetical protein
VFHFNKKHLEDPTIPMWVVKSHGVTFYVNHVSAEIPWSTKETPDNDHTKGSLKFKQCKLSIDDENCATITKLGLLDRNLPHPRLIHRLLFRESSNLHKALKKNDYEHTQFKYVSGGCGTSFVICDIIKSQDLTLIGLIYSEEFRVLSPNEGYYKAYDQKGSWIDEDEEYEDDE